MLVGDDLGLNVAGLVEVTLDEAFPRPKAAMASRVADSNRSGISSMVPGDLHAAATATERGLDGHRNAVLLGERDDLVGARHRIFGARTIRASALRR